MRIYCKNCKRHTSNTFPKKIVLISNNQIKGKSRCFICLTERKGITNRLNYQLANELHKPIIKKLKKRKRSLFIF